MQKRPITEENKLRLKYLGMFLRSYRVNSGLRQVDVSAAINLSRNSISRIERSHNFSVIHLFKLADAFDISLSELFQDIE